MSHIEHGNEVAGQVASGATYFLSGGTLVFGIFTVEVLFMGLGATAAIVTAIANIYFRRREDKRKQEIHDRNST